MNETRKSIIIGAGLAGLSCATRLHEHGHHVTVLEASDRVGGRVRTDVVDGFTLDHGFQVLLTAYPACRELLDYEALRLRVFDPGALVRSRGKFATLADPCAGPAKRLPPPCHRLVLSVTSSVSDDFVGRVRKAPSTQSTNARPKRPWSDFEEMVFPSESSILFFVHFWEV